MVRRAIVISFLAAFAAGAAHAQPVTSEPLDPPPGDPGGYDAPPTYDGGQQGGAYGGPAQPEEEGDPGDNPYADPAAGGAYDPSTGGPSRQSAPAPSSGPVPLAGPRGAAPYGYTTAPAQQPPAPPGNYGAQQGYGQQSYGAQTAVGSSCDQLAQELQRYRGPPDNPMKPRDEACAAARAGGDPSRPNAAFRKCSDDFFQDYEAKRGAYKACMEQDVSTGQQRLEQRETTVEAARSGYPGTAPQAAGRFARGGPPGWLGVQIQPVSPQSAYRLGVEGTQGALVANAVMGSPAQRAGLQRGDVIIAFDGEPIAQPKDLQYHAERLTAGQTVRLEVLRAGRREMVTVEITQRP